MPVAQFERFEFEMSAGMASSCYHQGRCDDDVAMALGDADIKERIAKLYEAHGENVLREELARWGAWSAEELANDADNEARLVWLAAADIVDNPETEE